MDEVKLTSEQLRIIGIFTDALPALRKELKISQTALGRKIGISRQMISAIERGQAPLTWTVMLSIVLFFKVNYNANKQKHLSELERYLLLDSENRD
ncbi:MAG: helix-turn-helix transcriptional regulator [Oscillospiraceae bacterium]|jgi:DNA-binding XRE family transcriptional regulator|nr:helix-turn-helix transcriptional regulator [Oscillospiraceae bacterium]